MNNMSAGDMAACAAIALFLLERVFRLLGWEKGAYIADELQDALRDAREFIIAARSGGSVANIDRAAETAAAKIKGVSAEDVRPIIRNLVEKSSDNRYGVSVSIDQGGNVSVDPSGLVAKMARKSKKWIKKVF